MISDRPPQELFRYRSANSSFFDDELDKAVNVGKTYCSPLEVQNDLFDSQPQLVAGAQAELERHIKKVRRKLGNGYTPTGGVIADINREYDFDRKQIKKLKQNFADIGHQFDMAELTLASLRREMKIACFSEQHDIPLLWAHYANSHRGICLGYSTVSESPYFKQNVLPVTYMNERPTVTAVELLRFSASSRHPDVFGAEEELSGKILEATALSKSGDWAYEKEWRVFVNDQKPSGYRVTLPLKPKSIFFGVNFPEERIEPIVDRYKGKLDFYRMKASKTDFTLSADQVFVR